MAAAVERLLELALAWESTGGLRALTGVADGLTGRPEQGVSGLRPFTDPPPPAAAVEQAVAALSEPARAMLEHVVDARRRGDHRLGPASRCCRRTRPRPPRSCCPAGCWSPAPAARRCVPGRGRGRPARRADDARAGRRRPAARDVRRATPPRSTGPRRAPPSRRVRRLELLLDLWGAGPPSALRSGGLGVRDLRATATALHLDEPTVALLVETAAAAGLVTTVADGAGNPVWLPTDLFDAWVLRPTGRALDRAGPGLAGQPADARPGRARATRPARPWNALAPELAARAHGRDPADDAGRARRAARRARCWPPGPASRRVVALLAWQRPRRPAAARRAGAVDAHRGGGARGHRARTAWRRTPGCCWPTTTPPRRKALAALLPEPVDHVLLQADLTAVAPGPARVRAGPQAAAGRRGGVARRRRRLPVHARPRSGARWTSAGPRPSCTSSSASVSADAGAAAAGVPRRRHRPHLRHGPGRARRGLPARRRRDGADRAAPPPARRRASACGGWRRRCWSARPRWTSCSPGCATSARRRWSRPATARCTSPGPTCAGPGRRASTGSATGRSAAARPGPPAYRRRRVGGHRHPGRRPGRGHPAGRPRAGLDALGLAGRAARRGRGRRGRA